MKLIFLIISCLSFKFSISQQWMSLHGSKIETITIADSEDTLRFFKNGVNVIAMPDAMADDFQLLFLTSPVLFK